MKYIKLEDKSINDLLTCQKISGEICIESFAKAYPQHIVESIPTENKKREELLMVASMIWANAKNGTKASDVVEEAKMIINAVNAACEKKEDNK